MIEASLPGARAALVGPDGLSQPYFYKWLLAIDERVKVGLSTGGVNDEAIKTIALRLGSPDGTVANVPPQGNAAIINGSGSILVDGTLAGGVVNLSLMADTFYPGATTYYGANQDGTRGWFPVSGALTDSVTIDVVTDAGTGVSAFNLVSFGSLTTDSLTEGSTHLYFTSARVSSALAAGDGIGLLFAGGVTTISLVGLPVYLVDEAGNQLVDEAGNLLVDTATVGLPTPFSNITDTPTTLAGYGITDAQKIGIPVAFPAYTMATLPSAAANQWKAIVVTDLGTGAEPCLSDGINWRKFSDRSIAS
jgi:hypothetical protein